LFSTFCHIAGYLQVNVILVLYAQHSIPVLKTKTGKSISTAATKLPNGLTVVSESSSASSTVTLTFPNAGSSSEHSGESGAALANKFLAFKSGSGLSSAVILRNLENNGASPFAVADRYSATIGYTAAPEKASFVLPLLATSCTYEKWDVKGALETAKMEVEESLNNIQVSSMVHLDLKVIPFP
jgi:hypothetical protein